MREDTREPLAGAQVVLSNSGQTTMTDTYGNFKFQKLDTGHYAVEVTYVGYERTNQQVAVRQLPAHVTIKLRPGNIQLADVVINGNADRPINALSSIDIKLRPANSSQDVLRMVPGLFIAQHAGGGKAEQIFLRGFDIDHGTDISLSVDGLPVNMVSHAHGQGYADLHFIIPEVISFVDFDKGPYYADKGDFATAGFADFHTKNYLEKSFIKTEAGRFGALRGVAGINLLAKSQDKSQAFIASELLRSQGYFDTPQDFTRTNIIAKFNTRLSTADRLLISGSYFRSGWDASGQIPERSVDTGAMSRFGHIDSTDGGNTSRANIAIRHIHEFNDGGYVEQQLFGVYYDFDLFSNFTFFLRDSVNGDQINQREARNIYGYRATYCRSGTVFRLPVKTEAGVTLRYDDIDDIALTNSAKRVLSNDRQRGNIREATIGAYLSETFTLSEQLLVNASFRLDHFYFGYQDKINSTSRISFKTVVSPKLNFHYKFHNSTDIYVRSGFGFHSNDARVSTAGDGRNVLPKAFGVDLGLNRKISKNLVLNAALWRLHMQQELIYVGDEGIVEPGGKTKREGIDLSLRYQLLPWLFADGDANLTRPVAKDLPDGENHIPLAPVFSIAGGFTARTEEGFRASIRYRFLADRPANEDNSVIAEGHFLADAVLDYTVRNFELKLTGENIFNAEWNEAQFDTESRLMDENASQSGIHFTPGSPLFLKLALTMYF